MSSQATEQMGQIRNWNNLYQKYRPFQLRAIVGQQKVITSLTNAAKRDNFNHAYLMAGAYGSGKTSVARILASLIVCPDRKPGSDVVCGKCKYCEGIHAGHCVDVMEIDGGDQTSVEDARDLKKHASFSPQELKRKIYIIDECIDGPVRIHTSNGMVPIRRIVNDKMPVMVKSFDPSTGAVVFRRVTGWFRNSGKIIYRLTFGRNGTLRASGGHRILTPDGEKTVDELLVGDMVCRHGYSLGEVQEQMAYGSMLGDASIAKNQRCGEVGKTRGTCPRLRFVHGAKQSKYLQFKYWVMRDLVGAKPRKIVKATFDGYRPITTWHFATKTSSAFSQVWDTTTVNGKKCVSTAWLDKVGPMGMAFWFCDDGSVHEYDVASGKSYSVTFHTQGFDLQGNELIRDWLVKKGFGSSILQETRKGKVLYRIALDKDGSRKFLETIWPFVPDSMLCKLRCFVGHQPRFNYAMTSGCTETVVHEKLESKTELKYVGVTYDIEVEGNHNYFAEGTLVHNCHKLSSAANSALLKVLEEPPPYVHFIFCTTDPEKVLRTIVSRCQRYMMTKIPSDLMGERLDLIAAREGIKLEKGVARHIARLSDGSLRDAIGNLEQVAVFSNGDVSLQSAAAFFGMPEKRTTYEIVKMIAQNNVSAMMLKINDLIMSCVEPKEILLEVSNILRSVFIARTFARDGKTPDLSMLDINEDEIEIVKALAKDITLDSLRKMADTLGNVERRVAVHINERWIVEAALVSCALINNAEAQKSIKVG